MAKVGDTQGLKPEPIEGAPGFAVGSVTFEQLDELGEFDEVESKTKLLDQFRFLILNGMLVNEEGEDFDPPTDEELRSLDVRLIARAVEGMMDCLSPKAPEADGS